MDRVFQEDSESTMKWACRVGNLKVVKELTVTDVEELNEGIRLASWQGHLEVVKYMWGMVDEATREYLINWSRDWNDGVFASMQIKSPVYIERRFEVVEWVKKLELLEKLRGI